MSKNTTNQQEEEPTEPEYQEPEYKSTIGEKEKALNEDSLLKFVSQVQNKKSKKKNKERQNETKNHEKKKKIIIDDPNDLKNFKFAKVPQKSTQDDKSNDKSDFQQLSQANYKNTAILATVSGQIEESDVSRFFNGLSIYKIHSEPGYFIIEFDTEEDLHKALQKNKTPYTNNIMVLVGEYSIEDENPKPEKHDFPKPRYPYDEDDYYEPQQSPSISIGQNYNYQQPQRQSSATTFTLGSKFGSQAQTQQTQQTDTPKYTPVRKAQPPYGKNSSYAKADSISPYGKKETFTNSIETSNQFDSLKDGE